MRQISRWSTVLLLCSTACASANGEDTLRRRLDFARERAVAFSGDVTITVASASDSKRHLDRVWVRRPDQARIERIHAGGKQPYHVLAINGDTVAMVDLENHKCGHGVLKYSLFEKVLELAPLQLDAAALVSMVFGDLTLPDDAHVSYQGHIATWHWLTRRNNAVVMDQDVQSGLPTRVTATSPSGVNILEVTFSDRDPTGIPRLITVYTGETEKSLEARLSNVLLNPALQGGLFTPDMPEPCKSPDVEWVLKSF